jgi:hypothetical protein
MNNYQAGCLSALTKLGFSADEFAELVQQDDTDEFVNQTSTNPEILKKLNTTPAWSDKSTLDAGDVGTRVHEMGLPRFGGV